MRVRLASFLLLAVAHESFAGSGSHPCAAIRDPGQRLACFDEAFPAPKQAPSAATPATQAPVDPDAQAREFGKRKVVEEKKEPELDQVSSSVVNLEVQRDGRFVATLENGQVWSQAETQSKARDDRGDVVTVRRGMFGSFLLVTRDGIATRVKRTR